MADDTVNEYYLLEIIKKLLKTDADLDCLLNLSVDDLRTLVACMRTRFDSLENNY